MSRYTIYITPDAWAEIKVLPGFMRSRVRRAISAFADDPRPPQSRELQWPDPTRELRRLRLDQWRVVYAVTEDSNWVQVLAVRKRPPYNYEDLAQLLEELR